MMIGEGLQNKKVQGPSEFWTALTVNICVQDWELANDSKSCKTSGDTAVWGGITVPARTIARGRDQKEPHFLTRAAG